MRTKTMGWTISIRRPRRSIQLSRLSESRAGIEERGGLRQAIVNLTKPSRSPLITRRFIAIARLAVPKSANTTRRNRIWKKLPLWTERSGELAHRDGFIDGPHAG